MVSSRIMDVTMLCPTLYSSLEASLGGIWISRRQNKSYDEVMAARAARLARRDNVQSSQFTPDETDADDAG